MASQYGVNSNGHFAPVADTLATVEVDEVAGFVAGSVIFSNGAGTAALYDSNSEANCAAIIGISDGTYADNATASYFQTGMVATGLSGLTAGNEYFADPTDGSLVAFSSIGSGEWTRSMGSAKSSSTLEVKIGPVIQK